MRILLVALLALPLLAPLAAAQAEGPTARLTIEVRDDRREDMTLRFDGLRRLTEYQGICLPVGARESRVHDDLGPADYEARDEDGRRVLSFLARGESVTIDMARGAPDDATHPLYAADANFCVPTNSTVEVVIRVPDGHTLFFLSAGGAIDEGREGRIASDGPVHAFYSYEAPLGTRRPMQVLDEAPFRVFVPDTLAPQAQQVASLAVAPFRAALAEAGLEAPFDTLRVLYTEATPHAWEAGHYDGNGFVSVKADTLTGDATDGFPYSAVKILVHESFHAASFPYGKGEVEDAVAWWLEGTARHAERQVDAAMPNATRHCAKSATEVRCWDFDDRITRGDIEIGYRADFAFDPDWEPSAPQSDDTRRFYYGYSEYVVGSWIARRGVDAYQDAWDTIEAAFLRGEGCPCERGWLEGVLDDPTLFEPWSDVRANDPARFETLVKPLVKDEEALQRELAARANPFSGIPGAPVALVLVALLAVARARRR